MILRGWSRSTARNQGVPDFDVRTTSGIRIDNPHIRLVCSGVVVTLAGRVSRFRHGRHRVAMEYSQSSTAGLSFTVRAPARGIARVRQATKRIYLVRQMQPQRREWPRPGMLGNGLGGGQRVITDVNRRTEQLIRKCLRPSGDVGDNYLPSCLDFCCWMLSMSRPPLANPAINTIERSLRFAGSWSPSLSFVRRRHRRRWECSTQVGVRQRDMLHKQPKAYLTAR